MKNTLNILLFLLAGTLVSDNCDAFRNRKISKNTTQQQQQQQQMQQTIIDNELNNNNGNVLTGEDNLVMNRQYDDFDDIINGTLPVKESVSLNPEDLFEGVDVFPERADCRIAIDEIKEGCDKIVIAAAVDKLKTLVDNVSVYQEMFELFLSKYQYMQNYPEMMCYCYMMLVIKAKYPDTDKGAACFDLNKFDDVYKIITEKNIRDIYSEAKNDDKYVELERVQIEGKILDIK